MRPHDVGGAIICGFSILGNSGAARNRGAELELTGRPVTGLDVRASAGYLDAVITATGASSPQLVGSRVFNVPRLTTSAGAVYDHTIDASLAGFLSADWSYVGDSLSGNNTPSSPRLRPSYTVTNLRLGARFGASELSLFLNNLFDTKANLGDITPGVLRIADRRTGRRERRRPARGHPAAAANWCAIPIRLSLTSPCLP